MKVNKKSKRVLVSFSQTQWKLIEQCKEIMGSGDAEVLRNIVLAWLAEKSLVSSDIKSKMNN